MKRIILSIWTTWLVATASLSAQAQKNVWNTLAMIKFEQPANQEAEGIMAGASGQFTKMVEAMIGTEVEVKGYIIPLSGQKAQSSFMFSAFPFDMCFFCGKAGAESVMDTTMKDGKTVNYSEKAITLKGTFRYYPSDPSGIFYKLENATLVK